MPLVVIRAGRSSSWEGGALTTGHCGNGSFPLGPEGPHVRPSPAQPRPAGQCVGSDY